MGPMVSASGYPQFTNYTAGFKDLLDYVFVPKWNPYQSVRIAPFPSEKRLSADVAIPSRSYPSDHVALVADLELKK